MAEKKVWTGTVDSVDEIEKLHSVLDKDCSNCRIVLRLNVDDESSEALVKLGSKYGCSVQESEDIMKACQKYDMNVVGVAFHVGTGNQDSTAFKRAISLSKEVFDKGKELGYEMNLLDFGGGWSGDLADFNLRNEKLEDLYNMIENTLEEKGFNEIPDLKLISEPGRYFNHHTIDIACSIINVYKKDGRMIYRLNEGIMGIFKDVILTDHMGYIVESLSTSTELVPSSIIGPSKLTNDVIEKDIMLPVMKVGDPILFRRIGAYSLSLTALPLRKNQKCIYVIDERSL